MKFRRMWVIALATMGLATSAFSQVKAFPAAEGFGADVSGGRGGTVYHVTNLNNSGAGSLRNAGALSNVTIVFDVGGYINITSKLGFTGSNVTIAGQTAPGGIGIRGAQVSVGADNIIIRHLRCRPGKAASASDGLSFNSNVNGAIYDHCSIEFSTDELSSIDRSLNVTSQWNILAWGLQTHSAGSLLYANNTTVHHTLWVHNHTRNPKARFGLLDWVNNVIFDWDIPYICADANSETHWANVDRCYFISGASGQNRAFTSAQVDGSGIPTYSMWLNQTLTDFDVDGTLDGTDKGYGVISGSVNQIANRYAAPQVVTHDPLTAYKLVLSLAGATPWARDEVDTLLMNDVKNQTRRIIARESDLPVSNSGFGSLGGVAGPADSDGDGMPDYFESALGLSTTTPSNNGDHDVDGYTNLEEYLNWLGAPHAVSLGNAVVDVDLRKFTSGFAPGAAYAISNVVNGAAAMQGDGHTARFTPTSDFSGLASFDFTVNDGRSATIRVGVLVLNPAASAPPTPNPMTFSSPPAATGVRSIVMTASPATSVNGVEYYFSALDGGQDSGWQDSRTYADNSLQPDTTYSYTVKARDRMNLNQTTASAPAAATTPPLPPLPPPAAHWKMDETSGLFATDASGNGNHGALQGTVPPAWTQGRLDGALSYGAATDGGVFVPSSPTIDFADSDFSVSFWLNEPVAMAEGQEEILIKGTIAAPGSGKRYEFFRKKTAAAEDFRFAIDDHVVKSEVLLPPANFATGDWVHVVGVRDTAADQVRLYADGFLQGGVPDATGDISQNEPLYIGDAVMIGAIDDVRIYDVALTGDQINTIFIEGTQPPAQPEIAATPASLEFGQRQIDDGPTTPLAVVIENSGAADLTFSSITITGADAAHFDFAAAPDTSALAAGTSRTLLLQFDPAATGLFSAALRMVCNDADEGTVEIALEGEGVEFAVTVDDVRDYLLGAKALSAPELALADRNGDEQVEIADLILLLNQASN